MMTKKKKIFLNTQKTQELIKKFGCSRATVYNALAYSTNSQQAENIRLEAIALGGEISRIPVTISR